MRWVLVQFTECSSGEARIGRAREARRHRAKTAEVESQSAANRLSSRVPQRPEPESIDQRKAAEFQGCRALKRSMTEEHRSSQVPKRPSERILSLNMCQRTQASKHTNKQAHRQVSHRTAKDYNYRPSNMHAREGTQQKSERASK